MKQRLLSLLLAVVALSAGAQTDEPFYRLELGGGAGLATHFSDVKGQFAPALSATARFPLNPRSAVKVEATWLTLKGDTKGQKSFLPTTPDAAGPDRLDFSVKDAVWDFSGLYELHFFPYGYVQDYKGYHRLVPYIQLGFGLTYGQAGKAFTANVPLGAGLNYKIGERLNLGLSWTVHFSLSYKLDGLEAPLGIPSEGFRNKDHYSALKLTLTYDLNPRCPTCNRD